MQSGGSLDAVPISASGRFMVPMSLDKNPANRLLGVTLALNMDELSATDAVADYSGGAKPGTPTGTTIVDSKFTQRKARNFADAGSKVLSAFRLNAVTAFSIEFWMRPHTLNASTRYLLDSGWATNGSFIVYHPSATQIQVYLKNNAGSAQAAALSSIVTDTWFHVVVTWDGVNIVIYRNATAAAPIALGGTVTNPADLTIGLGGGAKYDGDLCCLRYYSVVLTQAQVTKLANNYGDPTIEPGKVVLVSPNCRTSLDKKTTLNKIRAD